jgi:L-aspartate oxidase
VSGDNPTLTRRISDHLAQSTELTDEVLEELWRQHCSPSGDPALVAQDWLTIRQTMWNYVGLVRSRKRLDRAHQILRELHLEIGRFYAKSELSDALIGLRNGIQTALVVLLAAIEARTSAGAHYRID